MYLEEVAHYNGLSAKLREEVSERIRGFGARVRYRFEIGNPNPDPQRYNGQIIFPNLYNLDPTIYNILDKHEDKNKPKLKKIALIDAVDEEGIPNRFKKIRLKGTQKGILELKLEEGNEDWYTCMYLEMHPKLQDGIFQDKTKTPMFRRIDEMKVATEAKKERSARLKALNVAQGMSDKEVLNFCDAMSWDSTEDVLILRNKVEELADINPEFFNDLVAGKTIQYRSTIKQAMDKKVIEFDPVEHKFVWESNKQVIAILSPVAGKNAVDKMAEFLMAGGDKADVIYKKIKDLIK